MPELSAPLRVTWDIPPDPGLAGLLWSRLREGRVLWVDAMLGSRSAAGLEALVEDLGAPQGPKLSLAGNAVQIHEAAHLLGWALLARTEIQLLPPFQPECEVEEIVSVTGRVVPSVWSTPTGLQAFGEAVEIARGYGLSAVAVLNPPAPAQPLSAEDRLLAAAAWRAGGAPEDVELRVHDLFLARCLRLEPDPFQSYSGCQAGKLLAHLNENGCLVACRTLPRSLGDLRERSLPELWSSERRNRLRSTLDLPPPACEPCSLARQCRGACRGLAPELGRDPSCSECLP